MSDSSFWKRVIHVRKLSNFFGNLYAKKLSNTSPKKEGLYTTHLSLKISIFLISQSNLSILTIFLLKNVIFHNTVTGFGINIKDTFGYVQRNMMP